MRRVDRPESSPAPVSAQREAAAAFGDDRVLMEKYRQTPRHIEVQVFGDSHGNLLSLFERECTLAAPAPEGDRGSAGADAGRRRTREAVCAAARKAAGGELCRRRHHRIRFRRLGRVLHRDEHAVAGRTSGHRTHHRHRSGGMAVARGLRRTLPLTQDEIRINGHAIEARLYAEDPTKNFLPSVGRIRTWRMPEPSNGLRIDAGYREGDTVSPYYDAMLAKVIAWAPTRRRGDRPAQSRARRRRCPRHRHQHCLPFGAGDASRRPRQCHRHRLYRT